MKTWPAVRNISASSSSYLGGLGLELGLALGLGFGLGFAHVERVRILEG